MHSYFRTHFQVKHKTKKLRVHRVLGKTWEILCSNIFEVHTVIFLTYARHSTQCHAVNMPSLVARFRIRLIEFRVKLPLESSLLFFVSMDWHSILMPWGNIDSWWSDDNMNDKLWREVKEVATHGLKYYPSLWGFRGFDPSICQEITSQYVKTPFFPILTKNITIYHQPTLNQPFRFKFLAVNSLPTVMPWDKINIKSLNLNFLVLQYAYISAYQN
jgi:hypothetical protein